LEATVSRVERKKQEARDRILAAAERLFLVEGRYAKVTIREIAELADVSVGAVYLHFKTKVDVLAELLSVQMTRLTGILYDRIALERTGIAKFETLLTTVSEVRRDPALAIFSLIPLLAMSGEIDERIETLIQSQQEVLIDVITEIFRMGRADGTLRIREDCAFRAAVFEQTLTAVLGGMIVKPLAIERNGIAGYDEETIFFGFLDLLRDCVRTEKA